MPPSAATCRPTDNPGRAHALASKAQKPTAPDADGSPEAVVARLFTAGEPERAIERIEDVPSSVGRRELLWIDLHRSDEDAITRVLDQFDLTAGFDHVRTESASPGVVQMDDLVVLTVHGLRLADGNPTAEPARVDVLAKGNVVVTIQEAETAGLRNLVESLQGTSVLGTLTAATFAAVLIDGLVAAFFVATEDVERDIDDLDDRALRASPLSIAW